jgi:methylthioribose-1-phosphate isomerase
MKVNGEHYRSLWADRAAGTVMAIDQTMLPHRFEIVTMRTLEDVAFAIRHMQVRGAPLIGAAAAYGMVLAAQHNGSDANLDQAMRQLIATRPTAINLQWATTRMRTFLQGFPIIRRAQAAWDEAARICDEDVSLNQTMARHGLGLIQTMAQRKSGVLNVLTHCNAGWLATVDWGTALGPVYAAHDAGLAMHVWVDETRPRNQGAHLTAWELGQHGVPHTVITDNAGGHLMQQGEVDLVIVGADRVTRHGDVCNKIGTYLKALAAYDNQIPFYVAVPSPTIDWALDLQQIPIENRPEAEVATVQGLAADGQVMALSILPAGSPAANPAFDITPARLVTGILTERGVCAPEGLAAMFKEA